MLLPTTCRPICIARRVLPPSWIAPKRLMRHRPTEKVAGRMAEVEGAGRTILFVRQSTDRDGQDCPSYERHPIPPCETLDKRSVAATRPDRPEHRSSGGRSHFHMSAAVGLR